MVPVGSQGDGCGVGGVGEEDLTGRIPEDLSRVDVGQCESLLGLGIGHRCGDFGSQSFDDSLFNGEADPDLTNKAAALDGADDDGGDTGIHIVLVGDCVLGDCLAVQDHGGDRRLLGGAVVDIAANGDIQFNLSAGDVQILQADEGVIAVQRYPHDTLDIGTGGQNTVCRDGRLALVHDGQVFYQSGSDAVAVNTDDLLVHLQGQLQPDFAVGGGNTGSFLTVHQHDGLGVGVAQQGVGHGDSHRL